MARPSSSQHGHQHRQSPVTATAAAAAPLTSRRRHPRAAAAAAAHQACLLVTARRRARSRVAPARGYAWPAWAALPCPARQRDPSPCRHHCHCHCWRGHDHRTGGGGRSRWCSESPALAWPLHQRRPATWTRWWTWTPACGRAAGRAADAHRCRLGHSPSLQWCHCHCRWRCRWRIRVSLLLVPPRQRQVPLQQRSRTSATRRPLGTPATAWPQVLQKYPQSPYVCTICTRGSKNAPSPPPRAILVQRAVTQRAEPQSRFPAAVRRDRVVNTTFKRRRPATFLRRTRVVRTTTSCQHGLGGVFLPTEAWRGARRAATAN